MNIFIFIKSSIYSNYVNIKNTLATKRQLTTVLKPLFIHFNSLKTAEHRKKMFRYVSIWFEKNISVPSYSGNLKRRKNKFETLL